MKLNIAIFPILFFFAALWFVNDVTDGQVEKDFHKAVEDLSNLGN